MTFRKYFCNPGLLKKEFKRTKYIMLLHTILLLLFTTLPAMLLNENALKNMTGTAERVYNVATALIGQHIFMPFAIMVASFGTVYFLFSYMFKKKSVIFYGSMPEKKSCIFTTKFIAAVLSLLLPLVIVCAVNLVVAAAFSVNEYAFILRHFAVLFYQYVYLTAAFSFAASLSGNFLSMLGTAGFGFLLYPLTILAISGNISTWFMTYATEYNINIYYVFPPAMVCGYGGMEAKYLVFEGIIGAVLFMLGVILCTKRAAENSEKFFAFGFVNAIIKYCGAALIGLIIGCAIASVYADNAVLSFILYIIFAVLAYIILQAIFEKSFKAMFAKLKNLTVFILLFAAIVAGTIFDIFGFDFKLPDNPKSVTVSASNEFFYMQYSSRNYCATLTNPDAINAVLALAAESKATAEKHNYNLPAQDENGQYYEEFRVKLDNSFLDMIRIFPFVTREQAEKCFSKFYDTDEYRDSICKAIDTLGNFNEYGDAGIDIQPECQYYTFGNFDKKFVDGFKKVLKADIKKYSYSDISKSREFAYVYKYSEKSLSVVVYDCYEDTVNYLLENYFFIPSTEMIELKNPNNNKSVQITDANEMSAVFKVGRGYSEELSGDICNIYVTTDAPSSSDDDLSKETYMTASAYIDDLPEEIAEKLR